MAEDIYKAAVAAAFGKLSNTTATYTPSVGDPVEDVPILFRSEILLQPVGNTQAEVQGFSIVADVADLGKNPEINETFLVALDSETYTVAETVSSSRYSAKMWVK